MQETTEKTDRKKILKQNVEIFLEKSGKKSIVAFLSNLQTFEEVLERINQSFTNSQARDYAKDRAKEIVSQETNLVRLLEMRQLCSGNPDLRNLQETIETHWENTWKSHVENNQNQIEFFLQTVQSIDHLPYFAKKCMERPANYM